MVLSKLSSALLALLEAGGEAKSKDLPKIDYWRTVAGRPVGFVGPQGSGVPVTAGPLLAPRLFAISDAARKKNLRDRMGGKTAAASRQAEKATIAYLDAQEVMVSAPAKNFDKDMKQAALGMTAGIMKELRRKEYKDKPYQKYIGVIEDAMQDSAKTLPAFNTNSILLAVRSKIMEVVAKDRGIADIEKASMDDYQKVSSAVSGIVRDLGRDVSKAHLASLLVLAEQNAKEYGAPIETVSEEKKQLSIKHGCMDVRLPYGPQDKDRTDAIKATVKTILTISSPALFSQKKDAELQEDDRKELKDYIGTPYYAATRKKFEELSAQFVEKQRALALERMSRGDMYSSSGVRIGGALSIMSRIATNSPDYDDSKRPSAEAASVGYRSVTYEKYQQSMVDSPYTTAGRTLASRAIPWGLRQNNRYPSQEAYKVVSDELSGKNYAHDAVASKELVNRYFDVLAELTKKYLAEDLDELESKIANPAEGDLGTPRITHRSNVTTEAATDCLQLMSNIYEHSTSGEPAKPKDWVRFATNDYQNDIKPQFTRAVATRSAGTNGIVAVQFSDNSGRSRSYATTTGIDGGLGNKIVVLPDTRGDNFVIAHELGHAMENAVRQITECSIKFLGRLKDTTDGGKGVPTQVGYGMDDDEVAYRDQLLCHYTGKVYSTKYSHEYNNIVKNQSTEVWSTTVEKLGTKTQDAPAESFVDADFRMTALLHLHGTRGDLLDTKRSKGKAQPIAQPQRKEEPSPKPQPKPEPKPEPKPQPKPQPKPEPRPEPKPQPKPEPKPPAKPEPAKPKGRKFDRSRMRDDVTYIGRR